MVYDKNKFVEFVDGGCSLKSIPPADLASSGAAASTVGDSDVQVVFQARDLVYGSKFEYPEEDIAAMYRRDLEGHTVTLLLDKDVHVEGKILYAGTSALMLPCFELRQKKSGKNKAPVFKFAENIKDLPGTSIPLLKAPHGTNATTYEGALDLLKGTKLQDFEKNYIAVTPCCHRLTTAKNKCQLLSHYHTTCKGLCTQFKTEAAPECKICKRIKELSEARTAAALSPTTGD